MEVVWFSKAPRFVFLIAGEKLIEDMVHGVSRYLGVFSENKSILQEHISSGVTQLQSLPQSAVRIGRSRGGVA